MLREKMDMKMRKEPEEEGVAPDMEYEFGLQACACRQEKNICSDST